MVTRAALAFLVASLVACGKSQAPAEPAPAAETKPAEPTKAEPTKEPPKAETKPTEAPPATTPPATTPPAATAPPTDAPPATAPPTDAPPTDAPPTEPPPPEPPPYVPPADAIQPLHPFTAKVGDEVREKADPESAEGVIQRAIMAAMEPDEAKGWAMFEALLHEDQKYANALTYRRQFNFPAMRRKHQLFLLEPGKPYYKIDRILQESPYVIRIFVHNPKSMPTPCEVRLDQTTRLWKIGICSL